MLECVPVHVETLPDGGIKWKCERCGYHRHVERNGNFPDRIHRRCDKQIDALGNPLHQPGTELTALIEQLGVETTAECNCKKMATWMDLVGPKRCREHLDWIVERLEVNAKLQSWWALGKAAAKAATLGVFSIRQLAEVAISNSETTTETIAPQE